MKNLNAEQVKKALECCASEEYICTQCPIDEKIKDDCECDKVVARNALALINSQEQRIGAQDMTISELRKRAEKAEHDADRYAQRIKELTEENEAWQKRLIATEEKADKAYYELACEVENLRTESDRLKARTVDALTEFAESVKRYYSALPGATVGAAVRFYVDEKLKEALDKI